jgi:hypothetical protein
MPLSLAHIMKRAINIFIIFLSANVSGQIIAEDRWSSSIKAEFNLIKENGVDTLLAYYVDIGPWSDIPDSCNQIPEVWIIWSKDGSYFAKHIVCYPNIKIPSFIISSLPISFFADHIKDFEHGKLNNNQVLKLMVTDQAIEYLVFMTSQKQISLKIKDLQRSDKEWRSLKWINTTIQAIDTTKSELMKNNVR